jgi:hypothetical protein
MSRGKILTQIYLIRTFSITAFYLREDVTQILQIRLSHPQPEIFKQMLRDRNTTSTIHQTIYCELMYISELPMKP